MRPNQPKIVDITVKEGGFRINHCFLPEQVRDLAIELARSRVPVMEVSHGCGIGSYKRGFPGLHSDKIYLKEVKNCAANIQLSVYISGSEGSELELDPIKDLFDIGRVGISAHTPENIRRHIEKLKSFQKTAVAMLQRAHCLSPEKTAQSAKKLEDYGANLVYLVDTFGSFTPDDVRNYIGSMANLVSIPLGFQGRNSTGRALENSLAALGAGATWLDASLLGMGRGAGNASLEILTHLLQQEGILQELDLVELTRAAKNYALPAIRSLPYPTALDLGLAKHRLDFYPESLLLKLADLLELDLNSFLTELKKEEPDQIQMTRERLAKYLKKHRLDLDVVVNFFETGEIPQAGT